MRHIRLALSTGAALLPLLNAGPAQAQRAGENAAASSEDAFGSTVGGDVSGIYNENDTRGFSPLKAGNARLDGIYFDPVATITGRTRAQYSIRVGIAANDYPFPAPTGIVDSRLRSAGNAFIASLTLTKLQYSGALEEMDFQIPVIKDHLAIAAGIGHAATITGDAGVIKSKAFVVKPVVRFGGAEISPFFALTKLYGIQARPVFQTTDALVPPLPEKLHYLGQDWALGRNTGINAGITARVPVTSRLTFRGGIFRSSLARQANFTEVFTFTSPARTATHILLSDPHQNIHSWSGEAQLALKLGGSTTGWQHRLIAGYRARDRYTESGGSDFRNFGTIAIDGYDPEPEPTFTYLAVNKGRVKQSAIMLGYQGRQQELGHVNLGLQKARYRASFTDARTGLVTTSRDDPWLYNASFALHLAKGLQLFVGTQKGLEDSGAAPDNAANRNEQLPTTRSTQYEGGLRWNFAKSHLVVSLFQITKPYFSFDGANRFAELGTARYRGAEFSLAGHFDRLNVLAGAVAIKPEVSGPGRTAGLMGERPAGTPDLFAKIELQYRTDLLDGLTPTATLNYTGRRAVASKPVAGLSGKQLMLDPFATLDLGLRHKFKVANTPASLRLIVSNVFDHRAWKVLSSNALQAEERRRLSIFFNADF